MEFSPCTKRNENLCDRGASGTRVGDSVEGGLKRKGVIYWEREKETLDDNLDGMDGYRTSDFLEIFSENMRVRIKDVEKSYVGLSSQSLILEANMTDFRNLKKGFLND
ncbi:hypothetical protein GmHk_02G005282 [Glycine max]|nr:hypothetical protein GmHk_02G005282 [Glycine max]